MTAAAAGDTELNKRHRRLAHGLAGAHPAAAIVRELEERRSAPVARLRQVAEAMVVELNAGLALEGGSKLKMLISYIDSLPTR